MAITKLEYGSVTPVNITLSGLTTGNAQQSDMIDNTTNLFEDVLLQLTIDYPNTDPGGQYVWLFYSESQDGINFDGTGVVGTDNTYTSGDYGNIYEIYWGKVFPIQNSVSSSSCNITWNPGMVAPYFSIIIRNDTSAPLGAGSSLNMVGVGLQTG